MRHMLAESNLAISLTRQVKTGDSWSHVLASNCITESTNISSRTSEIAYLFPLYLYPSATGLARTHVILSENKEHVENIAPAFRKWLDEKYEHPYTPEEVLGYIYAVLHAPTYRTRYAEFLRGDFPRIPFPETKEAFGAMSKLGWALVQAHLLHDFPRRGLAAYFGKGDHTVEAMRYSPQEEAIWVNKTQFFKPVPQAVWDFHIGGYQVIDKYLKSRKGRVLSLSMKSIMSVPSLTRSPSQSSRCNASMKLTAPHFPAEKRPKSGKK
jgi:predicted helicase